MQRDIAELKDGAFAVPVNIEKATRFIHRLYHQATTTGSSADLKLTETAIDRAIREIGKLADLLPAQGQYSNFRLHRLEQARRDIVMLSQFAGNAQVVAMKAGIAFQEGAYDAAKKGYASAIEKNPTWDNLARLAYWEWKFGHPDLADGLYQQAHKKSGPKRCAHMPGWSCQGPAGFKARPLLKTRWPITGRPGRRTPVIG